MNLILFKEGEDLLKLNAQDHRYIHIVNIIKPKIGDTLDFGVIGGKKGKLNILNLTNEFISFLPEFNSEKPDSLYPITLIIGTPRPPVAKRLLKDLTTSGIKRIIMTGTDLGEKTYLTSNLWTNDNYMEYVHLGLSQGETTLEPRIDTYFSLDKSLDNIDTDVDLIALDNVSPSRKISSFKPAKNDVIVAIGGERGFTDRERELLISKGFNLFSMGSRVLRTETVTHQIVGTLLNAKNLI